MANTQEADSKHEEPDKQGLRGWKAAAAILGCGTLAGVGLFGVVLGVATLFINTATSALNPSSETPVAVPQASPRQTFEFDKFDLCNDTITSIRALNVTLDETSEEPTDTALDGSAWNDEDLVRSDDCHGTLIPDASYLEPWDVSFSYRAIVFSPDQDRDGVAQSDLMDWKEEIESTDLEVEESGEVDIVDEAYFVYASEGESSYEYSVVARKRSGIFRVDLAANDPTSRESFEHEVRKIAERLDFTMGNRIPE